MIYTLYIFDSNGCCIFYKEWGRRRHLRMAQDEEFKLMYGLIASIKSFAARISPIDIPFFKNSAGESRVFSKHWTRMIYRKEGFQSYATDKYRLHFYETPTSLKFLIMSDLSAVSLKDLLNGIYLTYVETVCRNVLVPARGRLIDSQFFAVRLESMITQSPHFSSKI